MVVINAAVRQGVALGPESVTVAAIAADAELHPTSIDRRSETEFDSPTVPPIDPYCARMGTSRILVGLAAAALVAGCGTVSNNTEEAAAAPTSRASVPGLVEPTCLAGNLLNFSDLPQSAAPVPDPMPIPAEFVPVRAVICEGDSPGGVTDHTVSWVEERREGNMDAVLAGYRLPSESLENRTCYADQPTPPIVWLVDDQGLGLLGPGLPTGECGAFKWDAITAIRALPLTERIVHRIPVSSKMEARINGEPI
ncbi:hypothetical protein [Rhodococcus sp. IEGM 1379]|uniref:hypothetical protein n=1 Tax=Rhodococcus sp. IEGM 1379 TaxID=3047086 RepID=UPI0024B72DC2|nr:hypothetical protein [Rhodococcus sp. IEGM 1379]MDI9918627.1 hypothetical protein [Rhodococcus sp. IEGM 1379]